jgi:prepilin-type N-terminal cleavage/methylation domain-containing protein
MRGPATTRLLRVARARAAAEGGFTLVEMLIAILLLTIIIASLTSVLVSASHTELDTNKRFQAQELDRTGLDKLRREIHGACAVTDTSGANLTAGTQYSAITVALGGFGSTCASGTTTYSTWCTATSPLLASEWALYRVTSAALPRPTCATAGKVKWVDYLQTSTPFCLPSSGTACVVAGVTVSAPALSLPLLHVSLPVDLNGPASNKEKYNLADDIALRNGTRS